MQAVGPATVARPADRGAPGPCRPQRRGTEWRCFSMSLRHLAFVVLALAPAPALPQPSEPRTLRFGVMVEEPADPDRLFRVYSPLLAKLRARLAPDGIQVPALVAARDLEDLAQRLVRGEVDFVIESLFPSMLLRERAAGLEPALLVVRRDHRRYKSVFFAPIESPVRALADLRGRTLVLQAERSTSAFALPRAELLRAGLALVPAETKAPAADAVKYVLAGAELNQAFWVLGGRGDAAAFSDADWEALPETVRAKLRIFHETRTLPRGLVSFRGGLAPATRARAERALLDMDQDAEGRAALASAAATTRFERLTAEDLAELRAWQPLLRRPAAAR
jgi:phosphonate transport system substrate-binding protein